MLIEAAIVYTGILGISQLATVPLLWWHRRRGKRFDQRYPDLEDYPGVSIVTPVKSPNPNMADTIRSILHQRYPGPIELLLAAESRAEPLLEEARRVAAEEASEVKVRECAPIDVADFNPHCAKVAKASEQARHPWLFIYDVDTRFDADFLRRAINRLARSDELAGTAFPVMDSPETLAARAEAVGFNLTLVQYFLFCSLVPQIPMAYGGAFLLRREHLERAGGFGPLLRLLTSDVTLAQALRRAGVRTVLLPGAARVREERLTWSELFARELRWFLCGRFHLPGLIYSLPGVGLAWPQIWLVLFGLLFGEPLLLALAAALTGIRIAVAFVFQALLGLPFREWLHAWTVPLFDLVAVPCWFAALGTRQLSWRGDRIELDRDGSIVRRVPSPSPGYQPVEKPSLSPGTRLSPDLCVAKPTFRGTTASAPRLDLVRNPRTCLRAGSSTGCKAPLLAAFRRACGQ